MYVQNAPSSSITSHLQLASIGALLDHLVRDRAVSGIDNEGLRGLDVREIESLAL